MTNASSAHEAVSAVEPRGFLRLGRHARLWLFVGAIWAFAATLAARGLTGMEAPGPRAVPWWLLAFAFYLAETNVVHLHFRREAHTISLNELPLVIGLFATPPQQLVLATVVGSAAALVLHRRQPAIKLAFNIGQFAASTGVAVVVFHVVASGNTASARYWIASFAAVAIAAMTSIVAVTIAIFLADGSNTLASVPRIALIALTGAFANASLALLVVDVLRVNEAALVLLLVPAGAAVFGFRAYTRQMQRHEHLTHLYETMRATHTSAEVDGAVRELLAACRRIFNAEVAELVLTGSGRDAVVRSIIGADGLATSQSGGLTREEQEFVDGGELAEGALLLRRTGRRGTTHPYLAGRGFKDAMVAPLRREGDIGGLLVLADKSSDVSSFTEDDRRVFDAFATHAAILLENDDKLRHQAFHDALTGLPNRRMILHEANVALRDRSAPGRPALLFLDLDDFKTVNDSLGHAAGDRLLALAADRLRSSIRGGDTAARLGGDEFAILLRNVDSDEAQAAAVRVADAFDEPFSIGRERLTVHPTVGIALADDDVADAEDMLRNADLAMYSVKGNGKHRHALYLPEMRLEVRRRHELIAALERAVDGDELVVHYQPIVELATGRLVAFESLVRWQSATKGLLPPGEFLAAAEETGLIIPIGARVLQTSVQQLRRWQSDGVVGPDVAVTVNLSAREIHDAGLPARLAALLADTGLHPRSLILELTESSAMLDFESTVGTLGELRKLGVQIALDDFGTGHSSLGHLWELPIDLVKIGMPFTNRVGDGGTPFAHAVFNFATSLPLGIVAECIETEEQAVALRELRCTYGQGYHYARPLPAEEAARFATSGRRLASVA
jgi:diguanylate cyclase (GGDEF)-like protein